MLKRLREMSKELTILYVEDDKELSKKTTEVFDNLFKSIDVAYDGQEGLQKYNSYQTQNTLPYDLVITDINMPHKNGIEMSQAILEQNNEQYIIIISAHNESSFLFEAINMGISSFLSKPMSQESLLKVLLKVVTQISEHKLAETYLVSLEEVMIKLERKNQELADKNAQYDKAARLLNTVSIKEEIQHPVVQTKLESTQDDAAINEQINDFIKDDLVELIELLTEIDFVVIEHLHNINAITVDSLETFLSLVNKYALTLSTYPSFKDLSQAMLAFVSTISTAPLPEDKEIINNCFLLLEYFFFDLEKWHKDLSSGDQSKFTIIDNSNLKNIELITNMWTDTYDDSAQEGDSDDIFDF